MGRSTGSSPSIRLLGGLSLAVVVVRLSPLRSESGTVNERLDDDLSSFAGNESVYLPSRIGFGLVRLLAALLASRYRLFHSRGWMALGEGGGEGVCTGAVAAEPSGFVSSAVMYTPLC